MKNVRYGYEYYRENVPNKTIWELECDNYPPVKATLKEALDKIKLEMADQSKWQTNITNAVGVKLKDFLRQQAYTITCRQFFDVTKNVGAAHRKSVYYGFAKILRFIRDGKIIPTRQAPEPTDNSAAIGISEHQYISIEEALELIRGAQGKHAAFREQIVTKLKEMPKQEAYAFKPDNLPADLKHRKKALVQLKSVIKEAIDRSGQMLEQNYIPNENLFILMRTNPKTKGVK